MIIKPTIAIWLDNRRAKKGNKYPVKIRITSQRQRYYYPANINLTEVEFENATSAKPVPKLKEAHIKLYELERQATATVNKIVEELHTEFTIELFEKYLNINTPDYNDVFHCYQRKIDQLKERGQIKTAEGYETGLQALKLFTGQNHLSFAEVDKKFLEKFETYFLAKKKSLTTIGIYARYLRSIFNEAIDEKLVNYELYPFGRNKYQIPQPANNKRALPDTDLIKLFQYKPEENTWEEYAMDMWMLSLLCQGMNMKDIANLRYKNIQGDKILFTREKTKRTKKANQIQIVVYLDDEAKKIISKWGGDKTTPNQFVFPIYSDDNTPLKNLRKVEQQIKMINKYMRKIAATLEIKQDFTFYAARHSFATTLKRQGRSTEEIQEFLGHTDKKTTERYLASFGDEHKRTIMNDFVKQLKES
jgi:integrase